MGEWKEEENSVFPPPGRGQEKEKNFTPDPFAMWGKRRGGLKASSIPPTPLLPHFPTPGQNEFFSGENGYGEKKEESHYCRVLENGRKGGGGDGAHRKSFFCLCCCLLAFHRELFSLRNWETSSRDDDGFFFPPPCKPILGSWIAEVAIIIPGAIERGGESPSHAKKKNPLACCPGYKEGG